MKNYLKLTAVIVLFTFCSNCKKDTLTKNTSLDPEAAKRTNADPVAITGVSPNIAKLYTAVTITGSNFNPVASENEVKFNGVTAVVNSASATQIIATVPTGATTGRVTVTTGGVTDTTAINFKVLQMVRDTTFVLPDGVYINKIAFDKRRTGYVYVSNGTGIYEVDPSGATTNIYMVPPPATDGGVVYNYAIDGIATGFDGAVYAGLEKYDPIGYVYAENVIIRISSPGQAKVVAGVGSGYVDGRANVAQFKPMSDLVADYQGRTLYLAEDYLKIRKLTKAGDVTTIADISSGNQGRLVADINGFIYFSDDAVIKRITPQGIISTVAGSVSGGQADGMREQALFNNINSMTVDGACLYIADLRTDDYAFNLRVINKVGYVSTYAVPSPFFIIGIDYRTDKFYTGYGNVLTVYSFK